MTMHEFDHFGVELSGIHLIEASAGTGKTYAIACLYLRCLIEQDLLPEQILVVTYTDAATRELRGRIRGRIREALYVFEGGEAADPFLAQLAGAADQAGLDRGRERLSRALTLFDTASIFTIHSFCLRCLQDFAFESGSAYETELLRDQTDLLRQVVDDFWRSRFFSEPAPLLPHALQQGISPESLLGFLKEMQGNPLLEITPHYGAEDVEALEERCRKALSDVQEEWSRSRAAVEEILLHCADLGRAADTYRLSDVVPALLEGLCTLTAGTNPYALFSGFEKCCTSSIVAATKKNRTPPEHPFFACCEELRQAVRERFLALHGELLIFAAARLPEVKGKSNLRSFDDLIADLAGALQAAEGERFAPLLAERYPVGLIDEFQDTDPLQYGIFRRIYRSGRALFLIGDPKQAIYSFRGADIFAYLQAAEEVPADRRHTLTGNWRSTPRLLTAFNALFRNRPAPFLFDRIAYHTVSSGDPERAEELVGGGEDAVPLQVWHLPLNEKGKALNLGQAARLIPAAVAGEIARLLHEGREGRAAIAGKPLSARDVAVIVRTHREGAAIQDALRELSVPSVMRSDRSVFDTEEARDLHLVLRALAEPSREGLIRGALVTPLLGRNGDDLAALGDDEQGWESLLDAFREYHHLWVEKGFMVMARTLLAGEGIRGTLLARSDGERRLTNLLHCLELIHTACQRERLGVEGALAWFGGRVASAERGEEYQIRLETDRDAVRIVTVHVSKGLEYPVVFCPFLWGGVRRGGEIATFHTGFTMGKDYGSREFGHHRCLADTEMLAENLRLLYVALTRARSRCYLVAGKLDGARATAPPDTSALAYLLHSAGVSLEGEDPVGMLADLVSRRSREEFLADLEAVAGAASGTIAVHEMPSATVPSWQPSPLVDEASVCRSFEGEIPNDWRVTSFTAFSRHDAMSVERPDRDTADAASVPAADDRPREASIFAFPRGARAGIFLHALFEELDFGSAGPDAVRAGVERGLARHGYGGEWLDSVAGMVARVMEAPLPAEAGPFRLVDLAPGSWLCELEFFFPLRFVTPELLRETLSLRGAGEPESLWRLLDFKPVRGMLRGFMDMVFEHGGRYYLVDWKSNHLGDRVEDYGQEALSAEMGRRLYTLQYLLYTVALVRYLQVRVPGFDYDIHFGGVFYFFLRGVWPERGSRYGIFHDRPPKARIDRLTAALVACRENPPSVPDERKSRCR